MTCLTFWSHLRWLVCLHKFKFLFWNVCRLFLCQLSFLCNHFWTSAAPFLNFIFLILLLPFKGFELAYVCSFAYTNSNCYLEMCIEHFYVIWVFCVISFEPAVPLSWILFFKFFCNLLKVLNWPTCVVLPTQIQIVI